MHSIYEFIPQPDPRNILDYAIKGGTTTAFTINWVVKGVDNSVGPLTQAVTKSYYYVVNFLLGTNNARFLSMSDYNNALKIALNRSDYKIIHLFITNAVNKWSLLSKMIIIKNPKLLTFIANHPFYQNDTSNKSALCIIQLMSNMIIL
jgi:hypothetical protein